MKYARKHTINSLFEVCSMHCCFYNISWAVQITIFSMLQCPSHPRLPISRGEEARVKDWGAKEPQIPRSVNMRWTYPLSMSHLNIYNWHSVLVVCSLRHYCFHHWILSTNSGQNMTCCSAWDKSTRIGLQTTTRSPLQHISLHVPYTTNFIL